MTLAQYKQRAAEFGIRDHMEEPMRYTNPGCVTSTKVGSFLPGMENASMKAKTGKKAKGKKR